MSKLEKFRKILKKNKLSGFLVPMNDEYQNEYVPECSQRMRFLTSFSGSAGVAIILQDKAAVFVDGRYELQAKQQVNKNLFEVYNVKNLTPQKWLEKQLKKKKVTVLRIGYDAWLHTENNIKKYEQITDSKAIKLLPVKNLIDKIWEDQPPPPLGKVKIYPIKYAGESAKSKIKKVIKEFGSADMAIITAPDSICWLLNIRGSDVPHTPLVLAFLILHKNGKVDLFIKEEKITSQIQNYFKGWVNVIAKDKLAHALGKLKSKTIIIDPNTAPIWFCQKLQSNKLQKLTIIHKPDPCLLPKACKNITEIKGTIAAHKREGKVLAKFLKWLDKNTSKTNITEISASEKLLEFRKQNPEFIEPSFPTICGFRSNGAIIHYHATPKTNKAIKGNGLLLIDSGGQYLDGTTDVTRTIAIGKPTKEQCENFTRVLKGHIAIAMAKFPEGTTGAELDILARYHLWQYGLDYDHGTGHGVGIYLGVHEGPQSIGRLSNVSLKSGMILSNEPGYYKPGEYGIRIENLVVVRELKRKTKSGRKFLCFDTITKAPIDMRLVIRKMLNQEELRWLQEYQKSLLPYN